ncbi:MAG: aminoacetone oxidase family FAD-binding enzyme, partial [Clostridiales bacterium]|nr:aminoacetone oxidase family FAD-binding enzyme [Clostridiales bacterium]
MEQIKVAVIGGGAAGLMAAYAAAESGAAVTLYEKNEKLGKKIYITGKGRCNLTNDCPPDEFLQNVVHGGKFLTGAIWTFPPERMMEFMEEHGLSLKTERGKRVFPASDHASDVTKTLEKACKKVGVTVCLNTQIEKIDVLQGTTRGIIINNRAISYDRVIVATGGLSYPSTGSTGDGLRFAEEVGHKIVPPVPSLTGLNLAGDYSAVQGISLKNAVLTAVRGGKTISSRMGELLFTHYGVSGPLVLSLSAEINRLPLKEISVYLDFKTALDEKKLDARLLRDFSEHQNENIKNVARGLLPTNLALLL